MIKQFKENDLVPETTVRTQHKKSLIFGILGKGKHMEVFWRAQILELGESEIFCLNWCADHEAAMENWLGPLFV